MIIKLICAPFLALIRGLLSAISMFSYLPNSLVDTIALLMKGLVFFPFDVWYMCIGCFVFWISLHLAFAIFNFVIKFIPFVNIGQ